MKRLRLLTVFASLTLLTALQAPASAMEKYHLILIPNPTPQVISTIAELGLPLDDSRTIEGEGLEIPLNESEIALLENRGISYRIIQEDLERALNEGIIAGAAIDVYNEEPPKNLDLLSLPNLINTPHIGGNALEAVINMGMSAIKQIKEYFND